MTADFFIYNNETMGWKLTNKSKDVYLKYK